MGTYRIKCEDPSSPFFGKEREFRLLPLLPVVRRRLFEFLGELMDGMSDDAVAALKSESLDNKNTATLLIRLLEYLTANDKLERLVSILICPVDVSATKYSIDEVCEYLTENCPLEVSSQVVSDFFCSGSQEHTIRLFGMIYEHFIKVIQKLLTSQKQ